MPTFHAVTPATHATRRWKRHSSHAFAARDALAPLVAHELPRAAPHLPLAFVAQGGVFTPVAVQGLLPGLNLFVAPDGRWLGGYTPAVYRGHPFALADLPDGQQVLAFDVDSGLLTDAGGEPLLEADGSPTPGVKGVLEFLKQVRINQAQTARTCQVLADHGLLQPWPIAVQGGGGERRIEGLLHIDEAALNALPADALKALQQAGALALAYCQLLSEQHLQRLGALAGARRNAAAAPAPALPTTPAGELDLSFLSRNGTLGLGGL